MQQTRALSQTWLFQQHSEGLPLETRAWLAYQRAQAIGKAYALTPEDVIELSPKFWQMHRDYIGTPTDGASILLLTIQYNLCAGAIAMFSPRAPEVDAVLQDVLNFDVSGQFMLTEIGHGLDARNIETTATMLARGGFELHTPYERAAKYMPPTAPAGMACVAVVFARLVDLEGKDRGIKSFVVKLHDGKNMTPGVTSKLLPPRGGSRPVNHSLTTFTRVRLPPTALLGTTAPTSPADFFRSIHRVVVGGLAMAALALPTLRISTYIAARYSLRRKVIDHKGREIPIIAFQTQKIPVLTALAQSFVMDAFMDWGIQMFRGDSVRDARVKHAIASVVKTVLLGHTLDAGYTLSERCGAQGLFEVNQIMGAFNDLRGAAIAEGDVLVVAIRLATELLLERYAVPTSSNPSSLLARHELSLFAELQAQLRAMPSHRAPAFDTQNLPSCLPLVMAIGHRMAYDAAVTAGVDATLVALYEVGCMKMDAAWYVENAGITRLALREMEARAVEGVFPHLEELLEALDAEPYITAPIISEEKWSRYVDGLQTFSSPGPSAPPVRGSGGMTTSKM